MSDNIIQVNKDLIHTELKNLVNVAIKGYESELMISTEDLEAVLINEDGGYTSSEARLIDEHIFFYVPERIAMDYSDEEVAGFVCRCMNDGTPYL